MHSWSRYFAGGPVRAVILGGLLACSPSSWGQTSQAPSSKPTTSLADSLHRTDGKQLHIFYVHGIASDGPGDHDSWGLRRSICKFVKDCTSQAGELDGKTDYADEDEFRL